MESTSDDPTAATFGINFDFEIQQEDHSPMAARPALIIIDVQQAFNYSRLWGRRNNPDAEANISALAQKWTSTHSPIVMVVHSAKNPVSPLHALNPGHRLKPEVAQVKPTLNIKKSVNSAFLGQPDLHEWLQHQHIKRIVVCGIQTNMCVETTARMGGNLGYEVIVPIDATHTFDLTDREGVTVTADELSRVTATNLQRGRFAKVVETQTLL